MWSTCIEAVKEIQTDLNNKFIERIDKKLKEMESVNTCMHKSFCDEMKTTLKNKTEMIIKKEHSDNDSLKTLCVVQSLLIQQLHAKRELPLNLKFLDNHT